MQRHDFWRLGVFRGNEFRPFVIIIACFFGHEESLVGGRAGISAFVIFRRIDARIAPFCDVTIWGADF